MGELATKFGIMLVGAEVTLSTMGLVIVYFAPSISRWNRRFFVLFFGILVAYGACVAIEGLCYRQPENAFLMRPIWIAESILPPLVAILLAAYILHCCRVSPRVRPLLSAEVTLWFALLVLMSVTPLSVWFEYVLPEDYFVRGPLYPVELGIYNVMLLLDLVCVVRWRKALSARHYRALLVCLAPLTVAVIMHNFIDMTLPFGFCMSICAFTMYYLILRYQNERDLRQQREIAHQRASVTVLQMRPHFIYNAMVSIYYLCKQDPDAAQQVTLDFTHYLRQNFNAIASEDVIPFTEELEHARAYLAVEQAQFEDGLFVHYDTPHVDFKLPPLTLQPLVENAVKHGMDPDGDPLHIYVTTRRLPSAHEVIVANTGADFKHTDDNEPHIALANIRQRLQMMCRATLEISPREGGGTEVRVAIPA